MLKKMVKISLSIAFACTLSSSAMAMGLVTGVLSTSFGLENAARSTDEVSHLSVHYLGSIGLEAIGQQMSAQVKLKMKTGGLDQYSGFPATLDYSAAPVFDAEEMQVKFQATDMVHLAIGDFDIPETHGFGDGYANATSPFVAGKYGQPTSWANGAGLVTNIAVNENIKAVVGLFATDPLRAAYRGDGCRDYSSGGTCVKNKDVIGQGGSGTMVAAEGVFGAIKGRFALTTGSANDDASATDKTITGTGMTLSMMYTMIGVFEAGFDYGTLDQGNHYQNNASRDLETQMAIFGGIPSLGPGMLKVLLASENNQRNDGSTISDFSTVTYTNIAYEIAMEPISALSIIYSAATTKPASGSATTASFIGMSLKKVF